MFFGLVVPDRPSRSRRRARRRCRRSSSCRAVRRSTSGYDCSPRRTSASIALEVDRVDPAELVDVRLRDLRQRRVAHVVGRAAPGRASCRRPSASAVAAGDPEDGNRARPAENDDPLTHLQRRKPRHRDAGRAMLALVVSARRSTSRTSAAARAMNGASVVVAALAAAHGRRAGAERRADGRCRPRSVGPAEDPAAGRRGER